MIASRFRSVGWVAGVAVAALGFYMVSLRVAAERGKLQDVEAQIASTQHDIRSLRTELGTRSRLVQLERWNKDVLALTAPKAEQYLGGATQLASFAQPVQPAAVVAPVQQASVEAAPAAPKVIEAAYRPVEAATSAKLIAETPIAVETVTKPAPVKLADAKSEKVAAKPIKLAKVETAKPKAVKETKLAAAKTKAATKLASVRAKASTKLAQAGGKAKAVAAKLVTTPHASKPLSAKMVETSYNPKHKDGAAKAKPAVHSAPFSRPAEDHVQSPIRTVALLDDHLLGQIGRAANAERGGKKNR